MSTWDAARLAQRRPLPKPRKMHEPVGEWKSGHSFQSYKGAAYYDMTCRVCGYHTCSCQEANGCCMANILGSPEYCGCPRRWRVTTRCASSD